MRTTCSPASPPSETISSLTQQWQSFFPFCLSHCLFTHSHTHRFLLLPVHRHKLQERVCASKNACFFLIKFEHSLALFPAIVVTCLHTCRPFLSSFPSFASHALTLTASCSPSHPLLSLLFSLLYHHHPVPVSSCVRRFAHLQFLIRAKTFLCECLYVARGSEVETPRPDVHSLTGREILSHVWTLTDCIVIWTRR